MRQKITNMNRDRVLSPGSFRERERERNHQDEHSVPEVLLISSTGGTWRRSSVGTEQGQLSLHKSEQWVPALRQRSCFNV